MVDNNIKDKKDSYATNSNTLRLSKFLAQNGLCSRREAERIIESGKVMVNGKQIKEIVTFLKPGDQVSVYGKNITYNILDKKSQLYQEQIKVWLFNKPKGTLVTKNDPLCRKTIFDVLPKEMQNAICVGRLDFNTEGLLLLTNNGQLARFLELPSNKVERLYRCRLFSHKYNAINKVLVDKLGQGLTIDGVRYQPIKMMIEKESKNANHSKNYTWVTVKLIEGKNREIRKVFEYFNIEVTRLIRIEYGKFKLSNDMKVGDLKEAEDKIIRYYTKSAF